MKKTIAISLSPNAQNDDVRLALKILFSPIKWFDFRETEKLEKEFAADFGKGYKALAVNAGRSALYLILKTLGVGAEDEVVVQALTCAAVPNSVLWAGAVPIYVDVNENFNIERKDLSEKISEKTRAIVIQHSFGIPAEIDGIKKTLLLKKRKSKVMLIEDCALSLGSYYKGKKVGTLGDISFFSFGRDKVISSVFGGMILTKDKKFYDKLKQERDMLLYPSPGWVLQQLLHPVLFSLIVPFYNFGFRRFTLGKILIFSLQKLKIISKAIYDEEKLGMRPKYFPRKMPGGLAILALNQLKKIDKFNKKRESIAKIYFKKLSEIFKLPARNKGAIWVRFPIFDKRAKTLIACMKNKGVLIGDWYKEVVAPVKDLFYCGYKINSCPKAEEFAGNMINLPTYPKLSQEDAEKVVHLIKLCLK